MPNIQEEEPTPAITKSRLADRLTDRQTEIDDRVRRTLLDKQTYRQKRTRLVDRRTDRRT